MRWQYYKRTGAKWMAEKAAEEGVHCLASGLCFKVVTQVDAAGGKSPRAGDQSMPPLLDAARGRRATEPGGQRQRRLAARHPGAPQRRRGAR